MFTLKDSVQKVLDVEVMNLPIGKAVLLTSALGVAAGLTNAINKVSGGKIPPIATTLLVAGGVENIPYIEQFLGKDLTQLISISALASGLNQQFQVSGRIVGLLDRVTNMLPSIGSSSVNDVVTTTETQSSDTSQGSEGLSGYDMGAYSNSAQMQQLPNVDDIDLALLSASGYRTA